MDATQSVKSWQKKKGKRGPERVSGARAPCLQVLGCRNPAAGSESLGVLDKLLHFLSLGFLACKMGILLPTSLSSGEDDELIRRQSALWADKEG